MKTEPRQGRLLVVGVGPGPSYLTERGRALMREGEVFVGGTSALSAAPAWGLKIPVAGGLDFVLEQVDEHRRRGQDVCVLTSGDPGFYSLLGALERRFPKEAVVEPGISSVQLLAARIGLSWQDMAHVSVHGRDPDEELDRGLETAGGDRPISILCDGEFGASRVADRLLGRGWAGRGVVGSRLGGSDEVVAALPLEEIASRTWAAPAVLLIFPEEWLHRQGGNPAVRSGSNGRYGGSGSPAVLPDEAFSRGEGMPLSRWEVRAILLAVAAPHERRVMWDVGAGSGGFAVDLSRANPEARVVAFEREPEACRVVGENAECLGARVEVVRGTAPESFGEFGRAEGPDLAVIGGSGGRLAAIIGEVGVRMPAGGRIVVTAVTLETIGVGTEQLSSLPWTGFQALQLSSARRETTGIMKGANPVTLLWADRKEES